MRKRPSFGLVNWVLYYISQKYTNFHNILLLDEIMSFNENEQFDIADWSDLDTFRTNIDFLIALNPQGLKFNRNYSVLPPNKSNTLSQQLFNRHRNGYEIGILLEHFKHIQGNVYLDSSMDLELDASKIPTACLTLWIERGKGYGCS